MRRTVQVAASRLAWSIRTRGHWSNPGIGASIRQQERNIATIGRWIVACRAFHAAKRTG